MELLKMFDNVKIDNNSRLSNEDAAKMDEFRSTLAEMREGYNKYIEFFGENKLIDYSMTRSRMSFGKIAHHNMKEEFINEVVFKQIEGLMNNIYYYFKEKYSVKLNNLVHDKDYSPEYREIKAKKNLNWFMNEDLVTLAIEDIFDQLGGFNFEDKAEQELKEYMQGQCCRDYLSVKGKNISIQSYVNFGWFSVDYGKYEIDYNNKEQIEKILKLINYYEEIEVEEIITNINYVSKQTSNITGKVFEIGNKVTGLKIFKNRKIQITFSSGQEALTFAREYLNYQV